MFIFSLVKVCNLYKKNKQRKDSFFAVLFNFVPVSNEYNEIYMKTNEKYGAYEAPRVEVIEVEVEKGFAASPPDYEYSGDPFATNP